MCQRWIGLRNLIQVSQSVQSNFRFGSFQDSRYRQDAERPEDRQASTAFWFLVRPHNGCSMSAFPLPNEVKQSGFLLPAQRLAVNVPRQG